MAFTSNSAIATTASCSNPTIFDGIETAQPQGKQATDGELLPSVDFRKGNCVVARTRRSGFTVASLLLLTAVVAIYAAAIMSARTMDPAPEAEQMAVCGVLGFFFGTVAGFFLGLFFGNRNRDVLQGAVEGAVFGPGTVVLLAIPESLPVVLVGGVVLVGFAVIVRLLTPGEDQEPKGDDLP